MCVYVGEADHGGAVEVLEQSHVMEEDRNGGHDDRRRC